MKLLKMTLAVCLAFALVGCSGAPSTKPPASAGKDKDKADNGYKKGAPAEPTNKEKIVGTWELTKTEGEMPPGAKIEFSNDGKLKMTVKAGDKEVTQEGTYTVDGDAFTTTTKQGPKEVKETMKIKKLTDKELVTQDEKGKIDEFKKK